MSISQSIGKGQIWCIEKMHAFCFNVCLVSQCYYFSCKLFHVAFSIIVHMIILFFILDAAHATAGDDIPWVEFEHAVKMAGEKYDNFTFVPY